MVYTTTVHHPTLMSMPCPHVHYSSTIYLPQCYELKLLELSDKTTLVLSNTRELDRVPSTK